MDVAQIVQLARNRTKATVNMISDNDMVTYFNIYYKKLHAKVIDVDKNYFWNEWTADIVDGQVEYTLLQSDSGTQTFGQFKLEKVGVKYGLNDSYRCNARIADWDNYELDSSKLEEGCPTITCCDPGTDFGFNYYPTYSSPVAIISDKSVFLYPKPNNDVTGGLKLQGSRKRYTLDIASTQDEILIVDGYEDIISLGIAAEVYRETNLLNEKNDALAEYEQRQREMMRDITTRKSTPSRQFANNLWHLV